MTTNVSMDYHAQQRNNSNLHFKSMCFYSRHWMPTFPLTLLKLVFSDCGDPYPVKYADPLPGAPRTIGAIQPYKCFKGKHQ